MHNRRSANAKWKYTGIINDICARVYARWSNADTTSWSIKEEQDLSFWVHDMLLC